MRIIIFAIVTLCQQISAVIFNFTEYTHISKGFSDSPCIGGCSPENECVINWDWDKEDCSAFQVAPIYLTSRKLDPLSKYCLTNCATFGEEYEWCITSEDLKWDYCSSYESKSLLPSGKIMAMTVHRKVCLDECEQREDREFYQCHSLNEDFESRWELCAPPVLPRIPVLRSNFLKYTSSPGAPHCLTAADAVENFISELADAIEGSTVNSNALTKVYKTDDSPPIDGYTMLKIKNILVPGVIRAHITNDTIGGCTQLVASAKMKKKLREQMAGTASSYEPGWLLGAQIGGTSEEYNLVPKSVNWRCKDWWNMEVEVKNWCYTTGGSVDMTVVVFYLDANTPIPHAFGVALDYKNDQNRFVEHTEKIHFNYF